MAHVLFADNNTEAFCSHRLSLAGAVRSAGWAVSVATPPSQSVPRIAEAGLRHLPIVLDRRGLNPFSDLTTMFALRDLFIAERPDLVHLRTMKMLIWGGIAAGLANVPAVIMHVTGLGYAFTAKGFRAAAVRSCLPPLFRLAFNHRHLRAIFQNEDDRAHFEAMGVVSRRRTTLIRGSGVDEHFFHPQKESEGKPVVVFPARLLWDKGLAEFVAAAKWLRSRGSDARFALVGEIDLGNRASVDSAQVQSWVRAGDVEWWGHCQNMPSVYAQARVVCLPSYWEGFPKALLEASACARAIVTTDSPGCRDAIEPGVTGLLVPPRNPRVLADALGTLLCDPSRCARMGELGRKRVMAGFTQDHVATQTLDVYRDLMAEVERCPR